MVIRRSAYSTYRSAVHPLAVGEGVVAELQALEYAASYGLPQAGGKNGGDYLYVSTSFSATDLDCGALSYGRPNGLADWDTFLAGFSLYSRTYVIPGGGMRETKVGMVTVRGSPSASGAVLEPIVSPVRDLVIDGQEAYTDGMAVTTTPTVSWTPPILGPPDGYIVIVAPDSGPHTSFVTTGTTVTFPTGVLVSGQPHTVMVLSAVRGGARVDQRPFASDLPFGLAPALSGVFTP